MKGYKREGLDELNVEALERKRLLNYLLPFMFKGDSFRINRNNFIP